MSQDRGGGGKTSNVKRYYVVVLYQYNKDNAYGGKVVVFVVVARGDHPRAYASAITFTGGRHRSQLKIVDSTSEILISRRQREIGSGSAEKSTRQARQIRYRIGLPPFLCARLRTTRTTFLCAVVCRERTKTMRRRNVVTVSVPPSRYVLLIE